MSEWKTVRLGDVCELIMGTSPEGNTISDNPSNGIEFHQGKTFFGKVFLNESKIYTSAPSKFANAGNVIMSVRAPVGDSNITQRRIAIGRGLCTFNLKDDFEKFYLFYFLNSKIEYLQSKSTGSTFKAVNKDAISDLQIPLPPLEEQKHIAAVLDKCTALIAKHKLMLERYDTLIKSRFIEMFGEEPTKNGKWQIKELGTLSEIGSSKRIFANEYVSEGIPFYRSKEIRELGNGERPSIELYISYEKYNEIKTKYGLPKKNDILIAAIGATIGYTWIIDTDSPFYYKDGNLILISKIQKLNSIFLNEILKTEIKAYKERASGSAQLALTIEKMEKLQIPVPQIELQNAFSSFVQQIDKSKFEIWLTLQNYGMIRRRVF